MSGAAEARYRRLLRWYPRAWRERDHDVLLHLLLDDAARAGRDRPAMGEAVSIALHGTAERLDRRAAVVTASAATIAAAATAVLFFVAVSVPWPQAGGSTAAGLVVVPPLVLVAAASLLRRSGLIGDRRALLLPVAGLVAGCAGAATLLLWSAGFDAADEGRALPPGTGRLTLAALVVAAAVTAAVVAQVLAAVLRATGLPRAVRVPVGLLGGAVAAPALGFAFLQPGGSVLCAGGVLAAALLHGTPRPAAGARTAPAAPRPVVRTGPDRAALALALLGTGGAVAALVLAFTAGPLGAFGLDGTQAMRLGLGLGALAGVPVVLAAARLGLAGGRFPRSATALLVAGLAASAGDHLLGPGDGSITGIVLAGALLAAAGALLVRPALPGTPAVRTALAALLALCFLASAGLVVTIAIAFLVPVAGVLLAVRASRRPPLRLAAPEPVS